MTQDERAIRRAVLVNPFDLTARLVYADWLEEHDRADFAAFIRASVRVYQINSDLVGSRFDNDPETAREFHESLTGSSGRWEVHLADVARTVVGVSKREMTNLRTEAGFVCAWKTLGWRTFFKYAPCLFDVQPIIDVAFYDVQVAWVRRGDPIYDMAEGTLLYVAALAPHRTARLDARHRVNGQVFGWFYRELKDPLEGVWVTAAGVLRGDDAQSVKTRLSRAAVDCGRAMVGLPPIYHRLKLDEVTRAPAGR